MLSPFQNSLRENLGYPAKGNIKKLVPNFYPKKNYIVHYRNLKYYVEKGLIVTNVSRILMFKQKAWLKPYIDFNCEQRKHATTPEAKDIFKLFNNSIYGKLMESKRKHLNIRLIMNEDSAKRYLARGTFESFKIINDDLIMIKLKKSRIVWDKPTFVGQSILDLSKLVMFKFHYEEIIPHFGSNAQLLFTDTDSLCYHFQNVDPKQYELQNLHLFDTSSYPKSNPCYSDINKKKPGTFKDEFDSRPVHSFIGLKPKLYSIKLGDDSEKKTAKGVKMSYVKNNLSHATYLQSFHEQKKISAQFYQIRSDNHKLSTTLIIKDAISPYDDKRYMKDNGIDTLAFGHKDIRV